LDREGATAAVAGIIKDRKPNWVQDRTANNYAYEHIFVLTKTIFAIVSPVGIPCGLRPHALECRRTPDS
jgi:hypothetical protein